MQSHSSQCQGHLLTARGIHIKTDKRSLGFRQTNANGLGAEKCHLLLVANPSIPSYIAKSTLDTQAQILQEVNRSLKNNNKKKTCTLEAQPRVGMQSGFILMDEKVNTLLLLQTRETQGLRAYLGMPKPKKTSPV